MKKLISVFVFVTLIMLAACGGGDSESEGAEEPSQKGEVDAIAEEPVADEAEEVTLTEASEGDIATNDYGAYEIVKVADNLGSFETGPVSFTVNRAFLAKFTPNDPEAFLFESDPNVDGTIHVLVTIVTAENFGEEYVSFSPFNAEAFVGGSKPYRGQAYLNEGESEISAGKSEEFVTAYNLEDEDLAGVTEVDVKQSGPAADSMRIGDDVEFTITFE